jgi:hypothetical protein
LVKEIIRKYVLKISPVKKDKMTAISTTPFTSRYIDISSLHRNRNMYPSPADFKIPTQMGLSGGNPLPDPVYKSLPYITGVTNATIASTVTQVYLDPTDLHPANNHYIGLYFQIVDGATVSVIRIASFVWDYITPYVTLTSALTGIPAAGTIYCIRKYLPLESAKLPANVVVANQVTLAVTSSPTDGYYNTMYIYFFTGPQSGNYYQILAYNGTTKIATLTTNISGVLPQNGNYYDINIYSYDNVAPLIGSISGPELPVTYTLRLDQLSLPILPLVNGLGDMSNYPYVYTELSAETPTADQIMFSNVPGTRKALFKTATYSSSGSWIQLTLLSQTAVIKFRPGDMLHFKIYVPNDEGIMVPNFGPDNLSPVTCDDKIQVSASFEIIRSE